VIAVLVNQINAEDILKPLLHTGQGLGEKGEALLVNQDVRILTSLKHPLPDKTEAKPLQYQIKAKPANFAAKGEEGIIEAQDYRGQPVLAAYRHIRISSEWGWGLVVKADKAELFAPLRKDMIYSFMIGLAGIFCVIGLIIFLSRGLTRPIRSLNHTAKMIAKGDMAARARVDSSDEVGHLAVTFNSMIQRIQDTQEELIRKEKLSVLGQLAGGVGHELRNPLGVISNAVYYLKMVLPDADERVREYLGTISSEVERSTKIVSDLLDLPRTKTAEREQVGISELLARVLERNTPPDGVEVITEMVSDLPSLYVDPLQIGQVLDNLIANAYKAMPDGGKVTIKAESEKDKQTVSITDTGGGISRENMEKIFEPLFTTRARGIGLGLSVSKNLVEVNGGSIEVESEEHKGSTFTVILPTTEELS